MLDQRFSSNLKYDFPAGVVVFLVALPLCLGIALASGAPLYSGLIAGVVGGIVVGLISGSHVGASGPAAGLAVIVFTSINDLGFEPFLVAVVLAGLMQVAMGFLGAGTIAYYFPSSVIKGMLASIGIILILKQIPHAIGFDKDYEGDMSFFQPDGENTFTEILLSFDYLSWGAVIIAAISLLILLVWDRVIPQRGLFKLFPAALVVVVSSILINQIYRAYFPGMAIEGNHLVSIPNLNSIEAIKSSISIPDFSKVGDTGVWITAFTIAIVASIETLLCVEATDKLDPHKRITPPNLELKAQGVGNIVAGLIGGIPVTQVIVRSSANISAGSQTKYSTVIHGFLLLISVLVIPGLLNEIPLSALAAVLLVVGYKLAKAELFKEMAKRGREQFVPFMVTIIAILLSDLLIGIGIGMLSAFYFILKRNLQTDHHRLKEEIEGNHVHNIVLSEEISFLNKGSLQDALQHVQPNEKVVIDGRKSVSIPYDIYDLVKEFESRAYERDIEVTLIGFDSEKVG